ncbi:hypothetical protein [Aeoliella sp.]|uniref:hypothetical protein n=1 Tax=Aeoliella sp. TaxID=2795800 RepID=UPI003CCBEF60
MGQIEQTFTGATNSDYNLNSNWVGGSGSFVPDVSLADEFAAIGSNTPDPLGSGTYPIATADLTSVAPAAGRVLIGFGTGTNGTLNVSGGGSLTAMSSTGGLAGDVVVGANGTGTLNVNSTGTITAELLDIRSTGTARITGPNANLNSNELNVEGNLVAEITNASSHSVINVSGATDLSGQLDVDLSSIAPPTSGTSWEIIETGTVSGSFSSVNLVGSTALGSSQALSARTVDNGSTTSIEVFVEQLLTLQVDRGTGALTILNTGPASAANNISIDGYTIFSSLGLLNTNWNSLDDQNASGGDWLESNPTAERLSELKEVASTTVVASGASLNLANGYVAPSAFGVESDLEFQYTSPDGAISTGIVEYTGPSNTLVVQIDPSDGRARLVNQSQFSVDIDGYTITSEANALLTSWNSLDDQNTGGGDWLESNPTTGRLSELKESGALTLAAGAVFDLGSLYNLGIGSSDSDVAFSFLINDGAEGESIATPGEVLFATIPAGLPGDYNGDSVVNLADYTLWRNNLGGDASSAFAAGSRNPLNTGVIDADDYTFWKSNFGSTALSAIQAPAAVPEPTTSCYLLLAAGVLMFNASRQKLM